MRDKIKEIVKEGRLEFANAGWSAPDEACPAFDDLLENMIIGNRFLD